MKKITAMVMAAAIGLTALSGTVSAQSRAPSPKKVERQSVQKQPIKKQKWKKGGKYRGQGAPLSDYRRHNLKTPPKGHRWVRDGNDFILVAIGTGIITSIINSGAR